MTRALCCLWVGLLLAPWRAGAAVPDLEARLEALAPASPMQYFRLAEEVAYESTTPEGAALARRLYLLAYLLDEDRGGPLSLGTSVGLALADLAPSPEERQWLLALARVLDEDNASLRWPADGTTDDRAGPDVAFKAATALGEFRAGRYGPAEALLEEPGVAELLARYNALLSGGLNAIETELRTDPPRCRECRNRRIVRSESGGTRLCYTCAGDPGPGLHAQDLMRHLRLESLLLRGSQESWSAQLIVDGAEPLRAVDPDELPAWFGVDADRPIYRDGQWVGVEGGPAEAAPVDPSGAGP